MWYVVMHVCPEELMSSIHFLGDDAELARQVAEQTSRDYPALVVCLLAASNKNEVYPDGMINEQVPLYFRQGQVIDASLMD